MTATPRPGRLGAALAIARRDLLEFVRDRRTLFITLLLPVVTYPVLALSTALGLRTASIELESERAPLEIVVAVSGADARPFAARLTEVASAPAPARPVWPRAVTCELASAAGARQLLANGQAHVWIDVPAGRMAALDGAGTAEVVARWGAGRQPVPRLREQFEAVMEELAADARRRRLAAAGLPASVLEPLRLLQPDEPPQAAAPAVRKAITPIVAGGVLVMLAVLTLTGGFYPAIDAIAGEKERGTIETLLIAPCATRDIVLGKFVSVYVVTLATLVVNVASIAATAAVAGRFLPQGLSLAVPGGATPVVVAMLAFVGLAALAAATCLAVTTAAKSGKEAQNTLTPVILLVSGLAGTALLPGMRAAGPMAAVPFAGQVLVARAAFGGGETVAVSAADMAVPLVVTLLSAAVLTLTLLAVTAVMLTDEDILFRGPDTAASGLSRPGRRERPTAVEGIVPLGAGLAGLWYAQGFLPSDLTVAIPLQQLVTVIGPLVLVLWWQRVDLAGTFAARPAAPSPGAGLATLTGAALIGAGGFLLGAAALLATKGTALTAEAAQLNRRLIDLMLERPWWLAWLLMAALPAVCEELLFRGWVLSAFLGKARSRLRIACAILAQAVCFAGFHLLPERMPQTFVLGLVLGVLTAVTRSILPAMVCHLAHNSMPLVLLAAAGGVEAVRAHVDGSAGPDVLASLPAWTVAAAAAAVALGAMLVAVARGAVTTARHGARTT